MFSALKKLFGKSGQPEPAPPIPTRPPVPTPPDIPKPSSAASPGVPVPPPDADVILIPASTVIARLPDPLSQLKVPAEARASVPLARVLAQLATGSVKVTFAEVRSYLPWVIFPENAMADNSPVELPLAELLKQIKPENLARRPAQRRVEVPAEIINVFGPRGESIAPPPSPKPAVAAPKPTTPVPVASPMPAAPKADAVPKPAAPAPVIAPVIAPATIAPTGLPLPGATIAPAGLPKPPTPAPVKSPALASLPPVTVASPGTPALDLELSALSAHWPEPIRQEIEQAKMSGASVALAVGPVERQLQTGKVIFSWKEIRATLRPSAPSGSAHDELPLELPLNVVAPAFMALSRPARAQKKIVVGDNIPDLFSGSAPAAPPPVGPAPAPIAPAGLPPQTPAAPVPNPLGEIFGMPDKRAWSPQEVVQRVAGLAGVGGTVLAMQDGLLVAAQVSTPLKAETIAAFLPQIFGRVAQYSRELQWGDLTALTLQSAGGEWHLFRSGKLFLAVLARAGEVVPSDRLARIANELGKTIN